MSEEFKPVYYRRYVDNIFVLFRSHDHFIKTNLLFINLQDYLNKCYLNMTFSFAEEKITTVYRKPTFSGVYTQLDSFLTTTYKFGMICTMAFRYF